MDFLNVELGSLNEVLNESDPFLALVAGASMGSLAVSSHSTGSSAVVVSGESFLHVVGIAAHVEGGVLSVVVSVSVHVCVCVLLFV